MKWQKNASNQQKYDKNSRNEAEIRLNLHNKDDLFLSVKDCSIFHLKEWISQRHFPLVLTF